MHQLCLIDTQQQDLRSVNSTHQLQSDIDENRKFKFQIKYFHE
jgi:hypothetical protein